MSPPLAADILASVLRWIMGIGLGSTSALLLYFLGLALAVLRGPLGRIVDFVRAIPILALLPLFTQTIGISELGRVAVIAWATGLPVYVVIADLARTDTDRETMLMAGGLDRGELLRWLYAPTLGHAFQTALRQSLGIGWISVVAAEMLGVNESGFLSGGLGHRVMHLAEVGDYTGMMVAICMFGVLGIASSALLDRLVAMGRRWAGLDLG